MSSSLLNSPFSLSAVLSSDLDGEGTALNGVDKDDARGEVGVAGPRSLELNLAAAGKLVVLGVGVEEGRLADAVAAGVLGDRGDVVDAEALAVAGLVDVVAVDVEVVVDADVLSLEETNLQKKMPY